MKKLISTPSRTKEILDQFGLRAKKGFGQNFLVDPIIVEPVSYTHLYRRYQSNRRQQRYRYHNKNKN